MRKEETVFTLFLLGVVALMVILTFGYRAGARLVPLMVGLITLILMIFVSLTVLLPGLASWYRRIEGNSLTILKREEQASAPADRRIHLKKVRQRELAVVGWLAFLTVSIYVLGFMIAIPPYASQVSLQASSIYFLFIS
jgi:small-conductance mechanosensitive channel